MDYLNILNKVKLATAVKKRIEEIPVLAGVLLAI